MTEKVYTFTISQIRLALIGLPASQANKILTALGIAPDSSISEFRPQGFEALASKPKAHSPDSTGQGSAVNQ